jgi:hypothetical protein
MDIVDLILDNLGIVFAILFSLLTAAAVIRSLVKMSIGKKIDIDPVGVYRDLPSSVTGLNKHKDRHD